MVRYCEFFAFKILFYWKMYVQLSIIIINFDIFRTLSSVTGKVRVLMPWQNRIDSIEFVSIEISFKFDSFTVIINKFYPNKFELLLFLFCFSFYLIISMAFSKLFSSAKPSSKICGFSYLSIIIISIIFIDSYT